MKRGAVSKRTAEPISVWLPNELKAALDQCVRTTDLDRSKLIRAAVREKLARLGISPEVSA